MSEQNNSTVPGSIVEATLVGTVSQEELAAAIAASHQSSVSVSATPHAEMPAADGSGHREEEASDIVDDSPVVEPPKEAEVKQEKKVEQRVQQKCVLTDPISSTTTWDPDGDTLPLPSGFDNQIRTVLGNMPNVEMLSDPQTRQWANTIGEGLNFTTYNEMFVPTLEDQQAEFRQHVEQNGIQLSGKRPKLKEIENQNLKGERAAIRMMSHLGLGTLFQVPLWHTGIWVTFKAPTESEIIELNRLMSSDKIELGRYSYGLAFTNTMVYTHDRLVKVALQHVYDCTLRSDEVSAENLINIIDCQDIPSLLWGFVCTMYPRGFQYRRPCINDPEKCNHVIEELLNVSKLQWVNNLALTQWQKSFMTQRRSNTASLEDVKRYKQEMFKTQKRRIIFNEGLPNEVSMHLMTPSIAKFIDAGHRWIGETVELVDKALGMNAKDADRNQYIIRHGQATTMRQYVHWVESMEFESNVIDDKETIEQVFNTLSSDNGIRNKFIDEVVNYINESTVAVIGIPVFDCPKCSAPQETDVQVAPKLKNIIPLDVIQLFFELITQRLMKVAER